MSPAAQAAPKAWNGSVNIQWNNPANWTPAGIPTAADDVTIAVAGTVRIANVGGVTTDGVASSVTITANVTLERRNGRLLTVTNGITINSSSAVSINVPFTAASLTQSGSGTTNLTVTALSGTTPQVATVDVTGGTLSLAGMNSLVTSGLVTVGTGATLARQGAGTLTAGGGVTVNGGTMTFAANGGLSAGGTVSLTAGSISFAGGGGLTSTAPVNLSGGSMTFGGAGGLNSTAAVTLNGGSMTFGAGGDLNAGTQTLTVGAGSSITTTAGANISAGTVNINGGSIAFGGNGDLTASGGAVNITGGGSLSFAGNGDVAAQSFSLAAGSTYTINFATAANPTTINLTGGSGALNGTVNITGAPGSNSFNILTGATSVDITGATLGTVPSGTAFGLHLNGTAIIVLDVTVEPIAPDATGSATGTCGTPLTWQHTIGATANDRYLLVGVSTGASAVTPTSVTFGAQGMGLLASQATGTAGVFIYGLVAPTRGTGTITVTLPAGPCSAVGGSLSYTGVDQTTSTGTPATAGGTGTTASVSPSTVQGDKVISVLSAVGATSATPQAGALVRWSATSGTVLGAGDTASRTGTGTVNLTMSWTLAPSSPFALAAVPVHAVVPTRAVDPVASAHASPRGTVVSVRSGRGSDLVGFRVWREVSGRRELLTPGLIAGPLLSRRASLLAGSDAGWEDRRAVRGASYLVESLHVDGRMRWTRAVPTGGPAPAFTSDPVADASALVARPSSPRSMAVTSPAAQPASLNQSMQWQLAGGDAVKVVVSSPGVVRVPADALFAAGIPVGAPAASLQLFRNGRPVPRTVLAADGATLRSGDAIEFYGHGMETRYSGSAVYWLVTGAGTGTELAAASGTAAAAGPATYLASVEVRERLTWFGTARNGDAEKFFGPAVVSQSRQRTLPAKGLDVSAGGARLEVALQGILDTPHSVSLTVNGLAVGSVDFSGVTPGAASVSLPPGVLVPGDNVVGLASSGDGDLSLEQYVRLVYPRLTMRGDGALDFTLDSGGSARLAGFDSARTQVLDITDPDAPFRVAVTDSSGAPAVVATGSGTRHLVAYLPEDAAAPASVARNRPSRWWESSGADLVVLGPSALFDAIQPLVDRRRSEGLTVALVDIEDVQDEFAGGEKSVDAVRSFLSRAVTAWQQPPRFLLLLGAATYDPRDYLDLGGDLVPSAAVQTSEMEGVSDSWFVGTSATRAISIGRFPVRSVAETQALVSKILGRRAVTAKSPWLLVSDARGTSDFPAMTTELRSVLPDAPATMLVRGSDTDDVLHQRFLDAARAGPALVNFTGHASELFWTESDPAIFAVDDVAALSGSEPGLWLHMTCFTGFFQDPRRQSLAVATLLTQSGGAWSTWASTASTYPAEHLALNEALVKAILVDGRTLGEATRDALAAMNDPEVQSTFVLLGDPSARAVITQALETAPKPSVSSGCSTTHAGSTSLLLLGLLAFWGVTAASRRSGRLTVPVSARSGLALPTPAHTWAGRAPAHILDPGGSACEDARHRTCKPPAGDVLST